MFLTKLLADHINVVLGYCLYQREFFVMHASAIEINKNSFIFFGASGSGKSSLSADLYKNFNVTSCLKMWHA